MNHRHAETADVAEEMGLKLEVERAEVWASSREELARDLMNQLTALGFSRNVLSQIRDRIDDLVG